MGSSACTCDARICNYYKKNSSNEVIYTHINDNESRKQNKAHLNDTLTHFMHPKNSELNYFKTTSSTASKEALNTLRKNISSVTPIKGLTMDHYCIDINNVYAKSDQKIPTNSTIEGYVKIKPRSSTYIAIICTVLAILLFVSAGYVIYRYISCPCKKRNEKALQDQLQD
jgi:hypothetical protein